MRNSVIGIFLAAVLLSAGSIFFVLRKANDLKQDLIVAKTKTDSLVNKTTVLDKDVKAFKDHDDSLAVKNKELEKSFAETNSKLASSERAFWKTQKTSQEANKKYNELVAAQKDWEKQLANLKATNSSLGQENKNLTNKVLSLSDDNKRLNDQLYVALLSSKDDILVETMTKSGRLNIKGKKVRKIFASLSTPAEMKNPTFKFFDPHGIQLPDQYGSFNVKNSREASAAGSTTKLELSYLLSKKIGPGRYRIEMLNENKHVGNLVISFR